jgi:hypothetical protein
MMGNNGNAGNDGYGFGRMSGAPDLTCNKKKRNAFGSRG